MTCSFPISQGRLSFLRRCHVEAEGSWVAGLLSLSACRISTSNQECQSYHSRQVLVRKLPGFEFASQ